MSRAGMVRVIVLLLLVPMMVYASVPLRRPISPKELECSLTPSDAEVEDAQGQLQVPEESVPSVEEVPANCNQTLASPSESGGDSSKEGFEKAKRGLSSRKGKSYGRRKSKSRKRAKSSKKDKSGGRLSGFFTDLLFTGLERGLDASLRDTGYGGGDVNTNQGYVQGGNSHVPQYNAYQNRAPRPLVYGGGEVNTNQGYVQRGNSPQNNPYQNRASRPRVG